MLPLGLENGPQQSCRGDERRLRKELAGRVPETLEAGPRREKGGRRKGLYPGNGDNWGRGLLRPFWAASLAEILAQYCGEGEPGREGFLGTRDKEGGAAQS